MNSITNGTNNSMKTSATRGYPKLDAQHRERSSKPPLASGTTLQYNTSRSIPYAQSRAVHKNQLRASQILQYMWQAAGSKPVSVNEHAGVE